MDFGLTGKTALITGGASGIGRATGALLCAEGARVILVDNQADAVSEAAQRIGEGARGLHCDLRDRTQIEGLAATVEERFEMPDVLVCAAGVPAAKGHPLELSDGDWREAWETDFFTVVRTMRAFVPPMVTRGWGRVVVLSSENALQPDWEEAAYNTAKAAVSNLVKGLSRCYARQGVLANTVAPALIETPMIDGIMDRKAEAEGSTREQVVSKFLTEERPHIALGRLGKAEEVAAVIAFLCSQQASYVNGATYRVDGGSVIASGG